MAKHRTAQPAPAGRLTLLAMSTGIASTAGVSGALAAQLPADEAPLQLVADTAASATADDAAEETTPQILTIAEFKPDISVDDQVSKAIQYESERVAADLAARAPQLVKPAEGILTSGFGMRWGVLHPGVDIANSLGTPILAAMDGTVIDSGPASGFGNWIRIKHDDGSITLYGHMQTLYVTVGQHVTAGQEIAGMGSLGFSTGSHLHFEYHPDGGDAIDPVPWFASQGISL
ncbi:MAG: M23 family metallopeptidase [Corynebacterium sp.]|nr:M23 family metallopeptidase [Corynebacterium sp.]